MQGMEWYGNEIKGMECKVKEDEGNVGHGMVRQGIARKVKE